MRVVQALMAQWLIVSVFLGLAVTAQAQDQAQEGTDTVKSPEQVVSDAANKLLDTLVGKESYYSDNLEELYEVIDAQLRPVFDMRYSTYLVLGNHWKQASDEQRNRFVDAFSRFLIQSYAKGLLGFNQKDLEIRPEVYSKDGKKAEVRTMLTLDNGTTVPINYRLRRSKAGWRVYDVRIEGVSYVQNYRSQFNAEINALGIDAVIERLNSGQEESIERPSAEG